MTDMNSLCKCKIFGKSKNLIRNNLILRFIVYNLVASGVKISPPYNDYVLIHTGQDFCYQLKQSHSNSKQLWYKM